MRTQILDQRSVEVLKCAAHRERIPVVTTWSFHRQTLHATPAARRACGRHRPVAAYSSRVAPVVSPARGTWTLDWATSSIVLSVAGAAVSLLDSRLLVVGVIFFVVGLIAGIVALRKRVRRNIAIGGIALNAANLVFDAVLVILAASR